MLLFTHCKDHKEGVTGEWLQSQREAVQSWNEFLVQTCDHISFLYFLSCEEVRQLPRRTRELHAEEGLVPGSATTLPPLFQSSARSVQFLYTQFCLAFHLEWVYKSQRWLN